MQLRTLGRTGLRVSAFTFGCGAIGGLMVRGTEQDQREAVATALAAGVNLFDTAPFYGNGASESNLGRALGRGQGDGVGQALVATKVRLSPDSHWAAEAMAAEIAASLEGSLRRLGRDSVDLLQLHHPITRDGRRPTMTADFVLDAVAPAMQRLKDQGKTRFIGITALGDADAIARVVASGAFDTAQVAFNLLNPTAGASPSSMHRGTDDKADAHPDDNTGMLAGMSAHDMGTIGIRILAGGALSATLTRDPIAATTSIPVGQGLGMGANYAADVEAAGRFEALVETGDATDPIDLALRYALSTSSLHTSAIGLSSLAQLRAALASVERGPLRVDTLARVARIQASLGSAAS